MLVFPGIGGSTGEEARRELIAQLNIPVGQIDEMPPAFMLLAAESNMQKRAPFRPPGFTDETHMRLVRQPIGFARIARYAGADHVFPSRESTFIARQDVIEI